MERDEFDELVTGLATFAIFIQAWWPPLERAGRAGPARRPRALAGWPARDAARRRAAICSAPVRSADLARRRARTVADVALLDELVHLLGPVPPERGDGDVAVPGRPTRSTPRSSPRRTGSPPSARSTRSPARTDTYAHVLIDEAQDITPDAVADAAAARRQRQLDHRRRPGAELLARRRRGGAGAARARRQRAGAPVPDEHQLPQPGGGVRPRRQGRGRRYPDADLPTAVRSTGVEPLLVAVAQDLAVDVVAHVADAARRGGRHGRRHLPAVRAAGVAALDDGRVPRRADRVAVVTSTGVQGPGVRRRAGRHPGRSSPRRPAACGRSTSRSRGRPSAWSPWTRHAWQHTGEDLSGSGGPVLGEEVQTGRAAVEQLPGELSGHLHADPTHGSRVVADRVQPVRDATGRAAPDRSANRSIWSAVGDRHDARDDRQVRAESPDPVDESEVVGRR